MDELKRIGAEEIHLSLKYLRNCASTGSLHFFLPLILHSFAIKKRWMWIKKENEFPLLSVHFNSSAFYREDSSVGFARSTRRLVVEPSDRSVVFGTATSLPLRDGRHRGRVDLVDARGEIRGGDPRRAARGRSSWLARRQVVAGRVMTGFPIAMLAKRTAVPGDSAAAAGLQGGSTTVPTALEEAWKILH